MDFLKTDSNTEVNTASPNNLFLEGMLDKEQNEEEMTFGFGNLIPNTTIPKPPAMSMDNESFFESIEIE